MYVVVMTTPLQSDWSTAGGVGQPACQVGGPNDEPRRRQGAAAICESSLGEGGGRNLITRPNGFQPESEVFDFGQGYHRKGHLKGNRMVQISAL